jgi:hypothetical protein
MSFHGKRELLVQVAPRYSSARHGQRTVILDEFVAVTGYERKYAIRLLLGPIRSPAPIRRPRVAHYGPDVQKALSVAWLAANGICAKRLVPFLPELIPTLERHGHLVVSDEVRAQLLELSPATVDRLLRPLRQPHGLSTTKPGRLLKKQIPVRTFAEWTDVKPGFLEADLVAHCGGTTDGAFLYTLTLTDVATTWTECVALLHRSQHGVVHALERARRLFPFPILGIDTDNGGEFINEELLAYCAGEQITLGRAVVHQRLVQELTATVGVQAQDSEWQPFVQPVQRGEHRLGAFVAQSGATDPASGHIHQRQRVQEWPSASPTAVRHEVNFDKARHRLVPVGEGLDRHLMLQQRAGSGGAQATFRQTSSRGCERSIDR